MNKLHLLLIFSFLTIHSFAQLRKIYFNPETGFMPHLQASCVAHFDYGISAQVGFNYEEIRNGTNESYTGLFSSKKTSSVKSNYFGGHFLVGTSTNFDELVNAAFFVGTSYGKYNGKYDLEKVYNSSGGYTYQYKQGNSFGFAFMARIDISLQFTKYFGLNFGLGGLVQPKVFGSIYGTVGIMVGLVQSKEKSTPHPI